MTSTTIKPAGAVSLLDQDRMQLFATKDSRLSACDLAVLAEITDRIIKRTGLSRPTGITHLERETGRNSRTVRASLERLLAFHYITIVTPGAGHRGTVYALNLPWLRHVSSLWDAEVSRQSAVKKAANPKSSLRVHTHPKGGDLACASAPTLEGSACAPTPTLRSLVCVPAPPQSYVIPASAGDYVESSLGAPGVGLAAAPVARDGDSISGTIKRAWLQGDDGDGESLAVIELDTGETISIVIESDHSVSAQDDGQRELASLAAAIGVAGFSDDLGSCLGKPVTLRHYSRHPGDRARSFEAFEPPPTLH